MILNKNNKRYKFDKLVKGFYTDIVKNFENESPLQTIRLRFRFYRCKD